MESINESLAAGISKYRKQLKLTQEALADRLGVSFQAVSKWENAKTAPDITLLPELADIFGITIDELFGRAAAPIQPHYDLCTEFPWHDDSKIRGVVCEGRKILQESEIKDRFVFVLKGDAKNVESHCNLSVEGNVQGNCAAGKSLTVGGTVNGSCAAGHKMEVTGTVNGAVSAGSNVEVNGNISGDVSAYRGITVGGDITAENVSSEADLTVGGNLTGNVSADGEVTVGGNVEGDISTEGEVNVGCNVIGDVRTDGEVVVGCDIHGNVTANGTVTVEGKIHGDIRS